MEDHAFIWDFFIAYSKEDKGTAITLHQRIKDQAKVFLDEACLQPGQDWDIAIPEALTLSCVIVVLVSNHLNKAYYARDEVVMAIKLARKYPGKYHVIPVYINGFDENIEEMYYGLRLKQGIDAKKQGGIEQVATYLLFFLTGKGNNDHVNLAVKNGVFSHVLLQYPVGPAPNPDIITRAIVTAFVRVVRPFEMRLVISEANAFRKEANPDDDSVTTIGFEYLLNEQKVVPYEFWQEALNEARLNGPRMLAALILTVPDGRLTLQEKAAREKLLTALKSH